MVALDGTPPPPVAANNNSNIIDPTTHAPTTSQTCNHKCALLILAIAIPLLSLLPICTILFTLLYRRRQKMKKKESQQSTELSETEIATRKLGPESETSSVAGSFGGGFGAVTDLEDGAEEEEEVTREKEGRSMPGTSASKTPGWWRMSFSSNQK